MHTVIRTARRSNIQALNKNQVGLSMLKTKIITSAQGAYSYPLLIKSLLLSGQRYEAGQGLRQNCPGVAPMINL
jgi:hypothetical protein